MKKVWFLLVLVIVLIGTVLAGNTIKVLRIYNDGNSTTIPLANIDSINHSKYDADGVLNADYITSVTWAIDSIYRIPINTIDSAIVADLDVDAYKAQIDNIQEHISAQGEMEVSRFQTELMSWLKSQEEVKDVLISDNRDVITVIFNNGLEFFVDFQNASFYEGVEVNSARSVANDNRNETKAYDVSAQESESIIESGNVLYIKGMSMKYRSGEEYDGLIQIGRETPVNLKITPFFNDTQVFLNHDWSHYGLIFISQTHGTEYKKGGFLMEDTKFNYKVSLPVGIIRLVDNGIVIKSSNGSYVYRIEPSFTRRMGNDNAIIYGSYCWSYYLSMHIFKNTVFGYMTRSLILNNEEYLLTFYSNISNGMSYRDAIHPLEKYWDPISLGQLDPCYPASNRPNSQQRYFSISMDDITQRSENGNPIVTGKINGYKNLKKDIRPVLFIHEGSNNFTPADENVIKVYKDKFNEVGSNGSDEDGSIKLELDYDFEPAVVYGIVAGFEYEGKIYYGGTKFYGELSGLDIKKTLEWGFAGDVYFGYEVTTNLKNKESQKNYQLVLYQGENPVLARQIEVKDGEDSQITKLEFGCSKSDFTLDYDNYTAEVKDLYLTIASTVSFNGQPETTIVFNDSGDLVPLNVTYDQKPDVRIKTANIKDVSQKLGAGVFPYYSVEITLNSTIQGTFWMDYARFYVKSIVSNRYIFSGKKHSNDDFLSDGDLPTEYVELDKYGTLAGYYEIVVNGKKISGSNHLNLTSSNDEYIDKIEIVEGAISSNSRSFALSNKQSKKINIKYNVTIHDEAGPDIDNSLKDILLKAPKLSKGNGNLREKLLLNNEWCR